jgi:hypothetical protein
VARPTKQLLLTRSAMVRVARTSHLNCVVSPQ